MAISVTLVAGGPSGSNHGTGPAQTGTFTPSNNSRLLVLAAAQENSTGGQQNDVGNNLTVTKIGGGAALTFTKKNHVTWDADGPGGPGAGAFNLGEAFWISDQIVTGSDYTNMQVQVDCGALNIYSYVLRVMSVTGETVVTRGEGSAFDNGPGGAFSFEMDQDPLVDSVLVASAQVGGGSGSTFTPASGWTEIAEQTVDFQEMQIQTITGVTDATVAWDAVTSSFGANFGRVGIAIELAIDTGGATEYTLTADPGVYTLAGVNANLLKSSILSAEPGVYTLTGPNVGLLRALRLVADPGVYNLIGQDVGLIRYILQAEPGVYTLAGLAVNLTYSAEEQAVKIVTFGLFQDEVTYWPAPVPDGFGGNTFSTPQAIMARWEQRAEMTFDSRGEQFVSQARVYVDDDLELDIGGYLYLGTSAAADPGDVKGAFKIRNFLRIPALRGPRTNNKALL